MNAHASLENNKKGQESRDKTSHRVRTKQHSLIPHSYDQVDVRNHNC